MKVREVIALVEADGWHLVRTRGDHRQYKHQSALSPGARWRGRRPRSRPQAIRPRRVDVRQRELADATGDRPQVPEGAELLGQVPGGQVQAGLMVVRDRRGRIVGLGLRRLPRRNGIGPDGLGGFADQEEECPPGGHEIACQGLRDQHPAEFRHILRGGLLEKGSS
jgi:hypothetical protein